MYFDWSAPGLRLVCARLTNFAKFNNNNVEGDMKRSLIEQFSNDFLYYNFPFKYLYNKRNSFTINMAKIVLMAQTRRRPGADQAKQIANCYSNLNSLVVVETRLVCHA